jgi:GT2 family glycosyltransferase
LVDFIAAAERLAADGLLTNRTVTFLGPARTVALGVGKDWLGFRAANWAFAFRLVEPVDWEERARYLGGSGRLAVAVADDPDELLVVRRSGEHHVALLRGADDGELLADRLEAALRRALAGEPVHSGPQPPPNDWATVVSKIAALPWPATTATIPADAGVTVCVLHRNRLAYLAEALASIPNRIDGRPVELLVLDNGSDVAHVEQEIRRLAGSRDVLRVIAFATPVPQAHAYNRGAAEARHQTVLFLDDDNRFTETGVERMAHAIAVGGLDIAVTALEVFDDGAKTAPTAGRLIFLGAAHSAGLFFNAFGDTAMAVRRDPFLALGGFHDPGFSYSHLDWATLAKAQAAGLRIGALQWPAVRYRRNAARADQEANKIDQEGARAFVFEAYGNAFDATLVARYAQKLQLEEL